MMNNRTGFMSTDKHHNGKKYKRAFRHSEYRKMLGSFLLLLAMAISVISGTLYVLFSSNAVQEIGRVSQSMLKQTSISCNVLYEQAFAIGSQLVNDPEIKKALYTRTQDNLVEYHTILRLSSIQAVYPFIQYISLYNGHTDSVISKKWGIDRSPHEDIIQQIRLRQDTGYMEFVPRQAVASFSKPPLYSNLLSYIFYADPSGSRTRSAVVVHVDESYIRNTILGMSGGTGDEVFILDEFGKVLSHTDPEFFLENFSARADVQRVMQKKENEGAFVHRTNNGKQLITYVKSDTISWIYVSVKPYRMAMSNIRYLQSVTFLVSLLLFVIGMLLSQRLTKRLYQPLQALIGKIDGLVSSERASGVSRNEYEFLTQTLSNTIISKNSLEKSLDTSYPLLRETYLRFLLKGDLPDVPNAIEQIRHLENEWSMTDACVLVYRIDSLEKFRREFSLNDQSVFRFAVSNVAMEMIGIHAHTQAISMQEDIMAILVQAKNGMLPEGALRAAVQAGEFIRKQFDYSLTIGIGDVVPNGADIHVSYRNAVEYTKYRFFLGAGSIIGFDDVKDRLENDSPYPLAKEKQLLEALRMTDRERLELAVAEWMHALQTMSRQNVDLFYSQLKTSIGRQFSQVEFQDLLAPLMQRDGNMENREYESIDEMKRDLLDICMGIHSLLEERRSGRSLQIVEEMKAYVEAHYGDPNLSLEFMSEWAHLSPGYMGRLFKNVTNQSFVEFVNGIRMDEAKRLLRTTDESASFISERVGLLNSSYFFTLFRKMTGMTPNQYRNKNKVVE